MKRGKIKEILLILMFLFLINVPCSTADESSLKVEISQKGSIEENEFFNGLFVVSTQITNIGKEDQTINEWSCSYGLSWAANIPEILTGLEMCARNVPGNITLKPNETYTRDLSISVNADADQKLLTFSLGFNPTEDLNWRSSDTDIH
ncbi:MAG: hypothetical protein KC618_06840, partial [Candidatus Omnitrophica bacterium]|nr:hypothetical protein [Candidatus Omnitrophota bacterium]